MSMNFLNGMQIRQFLKGLVGGVYYFFIDFSVNIDFP